VAENNSSGHFPLINTKGCGHSISTVCNCGTTAYTNWYPYHDHNLLNSKIETLLNEIEEIKATLKNIEETLNLIERIKDLVNGQG